MFTLSLLWVFVHQLGLFLLAGGMVGTLVTERWLWRQLHHRATGQALGLLPLLRRFALLQRVGVLLVLLGGLPMLPVTVWPSAYPVWLAGQLALYAGLVLTSWLVARPITEQLIHRLMKLPVTGSGKPRTTHLTPELMGIRRRLSYTTLIQLGILVLLALTSLF